MKLHLPVALLTAVISAMSYGAEPAYIIDRTMGSEMQSGTYNDNDVIVNVTGGDFAKYNMGGLSDEPSYLARGQYGAIQGASETDVMPRDHTNIPTYGDIYLNVSDGENISFVIGEGVPTPVKVSGDKYINITGGDIDTIIGGVYYKSGTNGFTHVGNSTPILTKTGVTDTAQWAHKDASNPDINISVTGGTVGSIRGGNSSNSANVYGALNYAKSLNDATYEAMMSDKAWSVAGDVNISVGGNAVITGDSDGRAIMGGGGTGHSVDGSVNIDISGGTITGSVVAGTNNVYTEVDSTSVKISGGTIDGSVYAGGNYADGNLEAAKYANLSENVGPVVKNGTSIVLSGGKVTGDVYAAGIGDTVNGGTRVTISGDGTEVGGKIYGHGVVSDNGIKSTVNGDSVLAIENSGGKNVNWDKIDGFNAVEFKNSQINFGTLSQDFEKVSAENSHLVGKFEDGEVQLNANDSWLEIGGDLTTTKGSSITNTDKPMTVTGDATFKGTIMENADLVVDGDIAFNNGSLSAEDTPLSSSVTNSNLVAGGNMSFTQTTMNGGTLSVGGELSLNGATVVVDSINNGNSVLLKGDSNVIVLDGDMDLTNPEDWGALQDWINGNGTSTGSAHAEPTSLTVNSDLKLATGSSFKGSGDSAAKLTANSITTDGAVTFEKSDVKATQGDIALSAGSKVTDSTLTAAENVTIGDSSTVSGSKVTSTNGNIDVAGSTLSNINLFANNGTITITNSEVTNSGAARYIYGETVKIENSTFESQTSNKTLFIDGNVEVSDGHFVTTGGLINFGGQSLVLDSKSTIDAQTGTIYFSSDTVVSNGATIEANGGDIHVYNEFIANAGTTITSNKGLIDFQGDVNATGATITAAGANINFVKDLVIEGSTITSKKTINLLGDVTATNTIFDADGGSFMFKGSNGKVQLNGGNELKGGLFSFQNSTEIIANGDNSISGQVGMSHDSKLTAESGTLAITTQSYSTLQNLQQTGDAQINVTANGGTLNLKGTSTIESLTLNNTTTNNTGSLTTSTLVTNGGTITNSGSLTVNQTSQLTGTTLTNTGTAKLQGGVNLTNSTITQQKGSLSIGGRTEVVNGDFEVSKVEKGTDSILTFSGANERTFDTNSSITATNGGKVIFGDNNNHGLTTSNGAAFVNRGGTYEVYDQFVAKEGTIILNEQGEGAQRGAMNFWDKVDANGAYITAGATQITFKDEVTAKDTYITSTNKYTAPDGSTAVGGAGTITFSKQVTLDGSTLTADNGKIDFKGGLVAKDTTFTTNSVANNTFIFNAGEIRLDGGNKLIAVDGTNGTFAFRNGADVIANGENTIDGVVTMADGAKLTAESGTLNITTRGQSSLNNVQQTGDAQINVTSNGDTLNLKGTSALENVKINGSSLVNTGAANLKNVALTDGSSVSNTGETLELGAATVSGSVGIEHNTDGTTKIGGITKTDDSASVSLSQTGGTVEFNGGKGTVAEIDWYNSDVSDAAMVQSGDGTVNVGHVISTAGTVEFKQTGNGEMNFGGMWINRDTNSEINQTGKGHINFRAGAANVGSVTQSGGGTFTYDAPGSRILSLDISNGSTFEAMCSVELDDVAISDATLFNAGTMSMDSLVMDNATLLFAASSLDSCSSFIFNGDGGLTGYGISNVSAADMIKEFGVVMSGDDARDLLQQWGSEVEFAFTLAQGSELFEKEFAYVLEQNLAEFTITLGEAAELSFADGEIKDITVEDTENGVVVKGIAVIPEPTTATLSLLALAALAARRRRR